jgi:hypothetical protein
VFGERFVSKGRDLILFSRRESYGREGKCVYFGFQRERIWEGGKTSFDLRKMKARTSSKPTHARKIKALTRGGIKPESRHTRKENQDTDQRFLFQI